MDQQHRFSFFIVWTSFKYVFNGMAISTYLNDIFYFEAKPWNDIYEIDVQTNNNVYIIFQNVSDLASMILFYGIADLAT